MKEAEKILGWGLPLLVTRIGEIYYKHDIGGVLSNSERLIIGLRYSEFLSETNDEYDLYNASIKRDAVLDYLGIDFDELIELCREQLGLH